MLKLSIKYFALLQEQANKTDEVIETNCRTCEELYDFLRSKYDFSLEKEYMQVAINDEFQAMSCKLRDGDKVVFIPPVAGGQVFRLSDCEINVNDLSEQLSNLASGGVVHFEGRVRNHNQGQGVEGLDYQVYPELALSEGEKILTEAKEKFNIFDVICVHRYGSLKLGDIAVWIGVGAAHRDDAYKASRFVIDQIKLRLPIWKKERYTSAQPKWVFCRDHHTHVHLEQSQYYCKQAKLVDQSKFKQAKVLVIGAGGLGSTLLPILANAGVGYINICDFDRVCETNLHRQPLYTISDIGDLKAKLAKMRIQQLNPFIKVCEQGIRIDDENFEELKDQYHCIVDCSDNLETKYLLHDLAHLWRIPLISASIHQHQVQLRTYIPGQSGCLRCESSHKQLADDKLGNCNDFGVLGSSVATIASLQASEVLLLLQNGVNTSSQKAIYLDMQSLEMMKISPIKNPDCKYCAGQFELHALKLSITQAEAVNLKAKIIDIREQEDEYIDQFIGNGPLVLRCHRGLRAKSLARTLRARGHAEIYALKPSVNIDCSRCES